MSEIKINRDENYIYIQKERTRKTENDTEKLDLNFVRAEKKLKLNIKATNKDYYNKIIFLDKISEEEYICVYSEENILYVTIDTIEEIYKELVKVLYKVIKVSLTRKYVKVLFFAYIVNPYKLKIDKITFNIDSKNEKELKLIQRKRKLSKVQLLKSGQLYNVKIKLADLLNSDEAINNYFSTNLKINDVIVPYKMAMKAKKHKKSVYYNLPIKSKYTKNSAVHIRRTIFGNLILVKRPMEYPEQTLKFRILESKLVSLFMYHIGKILAKHQRKNVNLFYEKFASKSEEGVFELFKKCKSESKKSKNYFVIDKNSEDYEKIKNEKNVVKKYSFKYYWLIYKANYFIASEAPSHLNILRSNNKYFRKATYDKKLIFLQHGIIYMKNLGLNSSFKKGKEGESILFLASSEKERDVIVDMLDYSEEEIMKTGLLMYDAIKYKHINEESKDIVTVMLTWKPYEESLFDFKESSYYKYTIDLYNMLKEKIDTKNIRIIPHPKAKAMLMQTDLKDLLWDGKISEVLEETKLLITDYSSICYNAFYQGAGVIFYQPDLKKYEEENGKLIPNDDEYIGYRVLNNNDLEKVLDKIIENKKIKLSEARTKEQEKIYETINEFHDGKNTERVLKKLKEEKII